MRRRYQGPVQPNAAGFIGLAMAIASATAVAAAFVLVTGWTP